MKMARTAAEAAVDAPKMSLNSRSHATWYTRAQKPDPASRAAISQVRLRDMGPHGAETTGLGAVFRNSSRSLTAVCSSGWFVAS